MGGSGSKGEQSPKASKSTRNHQQTAGEPKKSIAGNNSISHQQQDQMDIVEDKMEGIKKDLRDERIQILTESMEHLQQMYTNLENENKKMGEEKTDWENKFNEHLKRWEQSRRDSVEMKSRTTTKHKEELAKRDLALKNKDEELKELKQAIETQVDKFDAEKKRMVNLNQQAVKEKTDRITQVENAFEKLKEEADKATKKLQSEKSVLKNYLDTSNDQLTKAKERLRNTQQLLEERNEAYKLLETEKQALYNDLVKLRCSVNSVSQIERNGRTLTSGTVKDDFVNLRDQELMRLSDELGIENDEKADEFLDVLYEAVFFGFWKNIVEKEGDPIELRKVSHSIDQEAEKKLVDKMKKRLAVISQQYVEDVSHAENEIAELATSVVRFNLDLVIPEPAIILFNAQPNEPYSEDKHKNRNNKKGTKIEKGTRPGMMNVLGKVMDEAHVLVK
jgi:DNA repair exonuclease SbcCD ATPase subunit